MIDSIALLEAVHQSWCYFKHAFANLVTLNGEWYPYEVNGIPTSQ